jgi:hypothetical protein
MEWVEEEKGDCGRWDGHSVVVLASPLRVLCRGKVWVWWSEAGRASQAKSQEASQLFPAKLWVSFRLYVVKKGIFYTKLKYLFINPPASPPDRTPPPIF